MNDPESMMELTCPKCGTVARVPQKMFSAKNMKRWRALVCKECRERLWTRQQDDASVASVNYRDYESSPVSAPPPSQAMRPRSAPRHAKPVLPRRSQSEQTLTAVSVPDSTVAPPDWKPAPPPRRPPPAPSQRLPRRVDSEQTLPAIAPPASDPVHPKPIAIADDADTLTFTRDSSGKLHRS